MDTEVLDKREKLRTLINKSSNNFYFALCNALSTLFKRLYRHVEKDDSGNINVEVSRLRASAQFLLNNNT